MIAPSNSITRQTEPPLPPATGWQSIRTWAEMIKFSHSVFALPFAVLAMFAAARPATPSLIQAALIIICMVAARCAAMTFNRIVDAGIDARNPRTAGRALPRGQITARSAWLFFAASVTLFLAGAAGFQFFTSNPWPLRLAIPVLLVLCGYSFAKRFTRWSHLILGFAIAIAPVAAWIAIQPQTLAAPAWVLMAAVACWIAGFDIIYACQDFEFDRGAGLHSLPARIGIAPALWTARGLHVATVALLITFGRLAGLGGIYEIGVTCVGVLLIVENSLVRPNDLRHVNLAFFTINGVVGLLLGALGVIDILVH